MTLPQDVNFHKVSGHTGFQTIITAIVSVSLCKMSARLEALPPELIYHVTSYLPLNDLLHLAQTNKALQGYANSSVHTLSLGVFPNRIASLVSRLAQFNLPASKKYPSAFSPPVSRSSALGPAALASRPFEDPYAASVVIPRASSLNPATLEDFHDALVESILGRHQTAIRTLYLSLWRLSPRVAAALAKLPNLRVLSVRVEDPFASPIKARRLAPQPREEAAAWALLDGAWKRLTALRIEGAGATDAQLNGLIRGCAGLNELWVRRCPRTSEGLWEHLSRLEAAHKIQILGMAECGGSIDEQVMSDIEHFTSLKVSIRLFGRCSLQLF